MYFSLVATNFLKVDVLFAAAFLARSDGTSGTLEVSAQLAVLGCSFPGGHELRLIRS